MALPRAESVVKLAGLLKRGELTPADVVQQCLAQIDHWEARIGAWVEVDAAGAWAQAEDLQRQGWRKEQPLWGMPIGIKDIIDVAGFSSRCGAQWQEQPLPAEQDALVVRRLRQAGAIILGKTVTTPWACFDPAGTRNPWNLQRTPGGSSSGSAAAVATGMCVAALGTQTGGSILRPASFCGVSGLKPAHRPEFLEGVALVSPSLDHVGPIAGQVEDLQLLWQALLPEETPQTGTVATTIAAVDDPFLASADQEVTNSFQAAWAKFPPHFHLSSFQLPSSLVEIHRWHRILMAVELARLHRARFTAAAAALYSPSVRSLIEEGLGTNAATYEEARTRQIELSLQVRATWPPGTILAMPTTLTAAPTCETTGDARFNSPWSFLGLPAVTVPCGFSSLGLPLGMQFIGNSERSLLSSAGALSQFLQWYAARA